MRFRWLFPISLLGAALSLSVAFAPSAFADLGSPSFWIVPGGGVAYPPAEFGFDYEPPEASGDEEVTGTQPIFGGILGVKLMNSLGLEARGSFLSEEDLSELEVQHYEGNLTWFLMPQKHFVPLLTGGLGIVRIDAKENLPLASSVEDNSLSWNIGGGALIRFNQHIGLRLDARRVAYKIKGNFLETPPFSGPEDWRPQTELFAGLNLSFGGKPSDQDADGIPDKADSCPETPVGARVDARGCPIDTDSDGIADGLDLCDNTPVGAKVDASGCPTDSDKDGIVDGIDQCANTPAGVKVNARGCPLDADGDGVADGIDKCEGTPKGCLVDATGCPSDADGDGVCDGLDQCANTPADARVDAKGCPIVVSEKETELLDTGMIRLQNVNFDSNKSTIKPESFAVLDEVGAILVRWPELQIEIGGHCDSQGTNAHNLELSDARAKAVLEYLQGKFPELKTAQITAVGYGEEKPIAPNNTALGRAKNRRVEFKVLNTDVLKREKEKVKLAPK